MSISNAEEKNLLKSLKNEAPTKYETVWVKLHTGAPGEEGTENAATETDRKQTALTGENPLKNESELLWEEVAATETITHISLWSAEAAGTHLWYGELEASKELSEGEDARIKAEALEISLD